MILLSLPISGQHLVLVEKEKWAIVLKAGLSLISLLICLGLGLGLEARLNTNAKKCYLIRHSEIQVVCSCIYYISHFDPQDLGVEVRHMKWNNKQLQASFPHAFLDSLESGIKCLSK